MKLASINLNPSRNERGIMGWLGIEGREFSVRSAYELEVGRPDEGRWEGWRLIWRLKVQQRAELFLWLLTYGEILINYGRWRRGRADCWRCSEGCEDVHLIRDCKDSREVWECLRPIDKMEDIFQLDLKEWVLKNLRQKEWMRWGTPWPEIMAYHVGICGNDTIKRSS